MLFTPIRLASVVVLACCLGSAAQAGLFVTTGQTGAQVQCDVNHTQSWTFTTPINVTDMQGALFTMKRGSQTSDTINFRIFEGTLANAATATSLLSVTLSASAFTQSYSPIRFQGAAIALVAGHTYTGMLSSTAQDTQSRAYFIKGGSGSSLTWVDQTGNPVPAPGAAALVGVAGLITARRRREA